MRICTVSSDTQCQNVAGMSQFTSSVVWFSLLVFTSVNEFLETYLSTIFYLHIFFKPVCDSLLYFLHIQPLSGALPLHSFSTKGHERSSAKAWSRFTAWVLCKSSPQVQAVRLCVCLSHPEGLREMNSQDTSSGWSRVLPLCYRLHCFGSGGHSNVGSFVGDRKIIYSSLITVDTHAVFLDSRGGITHHVL